MWLFWIASFFEQKHYIVFGKQLGEFIVAGLFLFVFVLAYLSWPIALFQLMFGAFKLWKKEIFIGRNLIYGALTTFFVYLLIILSIVLGLEVNFGP